MTSKPRSGQNWIRKSRSLLINAAFIACVFFVVTAYQTRNMLDADLQLAPSLNVPTLSGNNYDLTSSGERPVLVYFFAPWCKVCAASADNLKRLRRFFGNEELDIVNVALDWSDVGEIQNYVTRHQLNAPVLLGDATVASDWQVYAFPTYYVLDSQQRVVRRDMGYSTQLGLLWRAFFVD